MQACERTYVPPAAIDHEIARQQYAHYCRVLGECGASVRTLDLNARLPDCTFIEDTAIVLAELAVICSMGAASRRSEPEALEPILAEHRELTRVHLPATLEGGDVLQVGRTLLVGQSRRTNAAGVATLSVIVSRYGYRIIPVAVRSCLHLKTACTALPDGRLLINPAWVDVSALSGFELLHVRQDEPWGANMAVIGQCVLLAAEHVCTAEMIGDLGFVVRPIELSEFAKAEGGVTCLSLLIS